jgi:hypothetical protein
MQALERLDEALYHGFETAEQAHVRTYCQQGAIGPECIYNHATNSCATVQKREAKEAKERERHEKLAAKVRCSAALRVRIGQIDVKPTTVAGEYFVAPPPRHTYHHHRPPIIDTALQKGELAAAAADEKRKDTEAYRKGGSARGVFQYYRVTVEVRMRGTDMSHLVHGDM